nr:hypothetical protein [Acetatifactor sp.]
KTTSSSGDTKYVQGRVDYVVYENGKAFLSIDESLYSIDDLDTVVDAKYHAAYNKASDFTVRLNKLPNVTGIGLMDEKEIEELKSIYDDMNEYEKSFVAQDTVKRMNQYVERLAELKGTEKTEETEEV